MSAFFQGFRTAAGQQILDAQQRAMNGMSTEADLESLRRAAMIIYDQYLSDKVSIVSYYGIMIVGDQWTWSHNPCPNLNPHEPIYIHLFDIH